MNRKWGRGAENRVLEGLLWANKGCF